MRKMTVVVIAACVAALFNLALPARGEAVSDELVEMQVKGVAVHPETGSPVVLLEAVKDKRVLQIWIGYPEAQSIALKMENIATPRPMTHDLLQNVLKTVGVKVVKVLISDLKNDIFFATIVLEGNRKTMEVDSRPSDAIALAIRAQAPIYAAGFVLERARGLEGAYKEAGDSVLKRYGMSAQPLTPELADYFGLPGTEGVLVSEVVDESAARQAGLKRGDVIVEIGGVRTAGLKEFYDTLAELEGEKEFPVDVIRDGDKVSLMFRRP